MTNLSPLNLGITPKQLQEALPSFTPNANSTLRSATTTVTGQSAALQATTQMLRVINKSATNSVVIGLGLAANEAEEACSSGVEGTTKFTILVDGIADIYPKPFTYAAWLGVGATVSTRTLEG